MKINIVSKDERYKLVNEHLCNEGICSKLCDVESVDKCDFLLLPLKDELENNELERLLLKIDKETVVLCGNNQKIYEMFEGKIIDYSNDGFVIENAYLTAEAAVSFLHNLTKDTLKGKKVLVSGYGRIGKELCRILKAFGSTVFAYARREEVRMQMIKNGVAYIPLEKCAECDIILNTVPNVIYSSSLIDTIPHDTLIVELASQPYGFENMNRVILASGLPGKILPVGASFLVFDTVFNILSQMDKELI